jgi:hypothetical protein
MAFPFFTIGHSTRSLGAFIDLLTASKVGLVVDVRAIPRSRTNPQYNRETLPKSDPLRFAKQEIDDVGVLNDRRRRDDTRQRACIVQAKSRITLVLNNGTKAFLAAAHLGEPKGVQFRDDETRFLPGE